MPASPQAQPSRWREALSELRLKDGRRLHFFNLETLDRLGLGRADRLPISIRILLEAALRNHDGLTLTDATVDALAAWTPRSDARPEIAFKPARVLLQDFTGVPCIVDLAALRGAMSRAGLDPRRIQPRIPVDLVIDHSVQVDYFGGQDALARNMALEFERNRERYAFLRWGQQAFQNLRIVPPGRGIVHQVNLEYLATCVATADLDGRRVAFPDTVLGTDSHTTMISGLGILGWGVGGIEAEAVMLGQPLCMLSPDVVGFRLTGRLRAGATATDLVLTVTERLRAHGVVGRFVEFFGDGAAALSVPDRATIANMAPEYGATIGFFPVDGLTLDYLRLTGRSPGQIDLVERYCKAQGLWGCAGDGVGFSELLELDLADVEPCLAGPRRPQDRVPLDAVGRGWRRDLARLFGKGGVGASASGGRAAAQPEAEAAVATVAADPGEVGLEIELSGERCALRHGSVVIAAITSCTNTSNPSVLMAAGLLARAAVERGLKVKPWVKTSLAPGSRVVTDYLAAAGLTPYLDGLGFHLVGYGCTTCIGNSGPLPGPVARAVEEGDLVVAAVLSGNRNFEGRIHPLCRANYLASPPLVVAYALAGTVDIDLTTEPLGEDAQGRPVYLRELWPSPDAVGRAVAEAVTPEAFRRRYAEVEIGDDAWQRIDVAPGELYPWDEASTYIQEPPFFLDLKPEPPPVADILGGRVLVLLGDSVTTDHISPAGSIKPTGPAGRHLIERGVEPRDFNSYGARRGNDRVMTRGTFANVRLRNGLVPGVEGGVTVVHETGEQMAIYDAAQVYAATATPLLVIAGKEYGSGSSRDWAAKGTRLLGVVAVLAESFERIHRSNLVGMGVLPLEFEPGQTPQTLGLDGREVYAIVGLAEGLAPRRRLTVRAQADDGRVTEFPVLLRIDSPIEVEYYRHGGILNYVLRERMRGK